MVESCHHHMQKKKPDILLWGSLFVIVVAYFLHLFGPALGEISPLLSEFFKAVFELMNQMWWGLVLAIVFVGVLEYIPQNLISGVLGKGGTFSGLVRAAGAGVLLDLCSHGILLVGMKLYKKGASLGQVIAFLVASPWNSLSLTVILWSLVGLRWTLVFLLLSLAIALISGGVFEYLVQKNILPENPFQENTSKEFEFRREFFHWIKNITWKPKSFFVLLSHGIRGSRMILRWIFFGVVLAALLRIALSPESFALFFGPTLRGLGLTLVGATILEVCSEGSTPLAAELLTRAKAPGNAFSFLMAGVSTDYTEIMALKETTLSWKIALFLPLITLPQIIFLGIILNSGL